jgi:hypothetical protein
MFRRNHHHQGAHCLSLLKLQLLKQSKYIGVVNMAVWLHMLPGPCWCMCAALFGTLDNIKMHATNVKINEI